MDEGGVKRDDGGAEDFAEAHGAGSEVLVDEDLEGGGGDGAAEGVAAVGAAMLAGLDAEHDVAVGEDGGYGVDCGVGE